MNGHPSLLTRFSCVLYEGGFWEIVSWKARVCNSKRVASAYSCPLRVRGDDMGCRMVRMFPWRPTG